ncbi:aldo/keto reductase [Variovorax sp. WS11]|uniref:aldo/keto reductase n=1 Tax=Variovorax sp. WS11 TaxID=1105204 RepID=UPI000D0DBA63|nr:aldo/keto reductase [Variovorax sp. WS11]NDZ17469.1 aldo/keto reductase [Variovorax sp. WS11]PSL85996.1 aldo/keto reductase [Variovorax sp. WS11]
MEYVRLGRTGLTVSRLCLGCMSYGTAGWEVHPWALGREDSMPFFRKAAEAGINFFDTADHYSYGASEEILGDAVRALFRRDEVVVATKVGLPMGPGPNLAGLSRKRILESVNQSLKRLKFDHVDLLYTHRFDPNTELEEMMLALDQLVREGKVLYLGACSATSWQFAKVREMQRAAGLAQFQVMQNFYNLAYREEEREMIPYCQYEGVALVPWSPIARGFLAGTKPRDGSIVGNRSATDKVLQSYFGSEADYRVLDAVEAAAEQYGVSSAQVAYAWILSKPYITAPIIGADALTQFDQTIAAASLKLDDTTLHALEAAYEPHAMLGQVTIGGRPRL